MLDLSEGENRTSINEPWAYQFVHTVDRLCICWRMYVLGYTDNFVALDEYVRIPQHIDMVMLIVHEHSTATKQLERHLVVVIDGLYLK